MSSPTAAAPLRLPHDAVRLLTAQGRRGFIVKNGKIVAIDVLADPARLRQLDLAAWAG